MRRAKRRVQGVALMVLGLLPIASVAFAAKSSLKVNQIRKGNVNAKKGGHGGGSDSGGNGL
ncbi:MAG: hypothetical protein KGL53_12230 [Elusimicrobia bacterium]|nr:hypothetical protein [Elusimicrobiota bacterium]